MLEATRAKTDKVPKAKMSPLFVHGLEKKREELKEAHLAFHLLLTYQVLLDHVRSVQKYSFFMFGKL